MESQEKPPTTDERRRGRNGEECGREQTGRGQAGSAGRRLTTATTKVGKSHVSNVRTFFRPQQSMAELFLSVMKCPATSQDDDEVKVRRPVAATMDRHPMAGCLFFRLLRCKNIPSADPLEYGTRHKHVNKRKVVKC